MVELRPYPFGALVARALRELDEKQAIFDLPARKFVLGDARRDLSVRFHGHVAATPYGPAAGPQTQMAQNLVLSWLGGARVLELKTVQIKDELAIPRPCIDMQTVGYNVEWSQELKLEQSLEEYVKGSMLIEILVASGKLALAPGFERTVFDMSVGYDLAGIRSERVQAFLHGMLDARALVERLRAEIPVEHKQLRDLAFTTRLSDTLTLSTFHGCPPDEIERMLDCLLREHGLHCIVKLNPMLLGPVEARRIVNEALGYTDIRIPESAFERDTRWEQAVGFVERLSELARSLELGFGVKLTNTLIVENRRGFFPASEKEMYLSGPPLHVLAMHLVLRFRRHFGGELPISFSAGIERSNFPDAVAQGLVPVTVCSDLLRPGGYARAAGYFQELERRMDALGAASIDDYVLKAAGETDPRRLSAARVRNTERYVGGLEVDSRYQRAHNEKPPRKIGSRLELFDCITCDKCVPVCPNDANFTFVLPQQEIPIVALVREAQGWRARRDGSLHIEEKHQIGTFHDFCNECGNCDVFCPEDGGPYVLKPRFFGSEEAWRAAAPKDGFFLERGPGLERIHGRFDGREYRLELRAERAAYCGPGFALEFDVTDPAGTAEGDATSEVNLTFFEIMTRLRRALLEPGEINYVAGLAGARGE